MEQWMQDALQKTIDKFRIGASIAAKQGILPYTGEKGRFGPAPFDGNSWWTGCSPTAATGRRSGAGC